MRLQSKCKKMVSSQVRKCVARMAHNMSSSPCILHVNYGTIIEILFSLNYILYLPGEREREREKCYLSSPNPIRSDTLDHKSIRSYSSLEELLM